MVDKDRDYQEIFGIYNSVQMNVRKTPKGAHSCPKSAGRVISKISFSRSGVDIKVVLHL